MLCLFLSRAIREAFGDCLPHPCTINNWLNKIDGTPGFTASSFQVLKEKVITFYIYKFFSEFLDQHQIFFFIWSCQSPD